MINVAVLGHGVVGSGVVEVIETNAKSIAKRCGKTLNVKHILDIREFNDLPYAHKFTKDFNVILNDESVEVVAEVMGGVHPAYDFVKACLEAKKSVVTSNKELVAAKGAELLKTALDNNVNFFFEASVGGGIPIIRPMHQCLAANRIDEVAGILNGTTNFILTKMIHEQMDFADALKLAQDLGYAERNPEADVEGHDACRKICILASLAYGKHVYPDNVYTEGITKITLNDVEYADHYNCVIKLIGRAKMLDSGKLMIMVSPALIKKSSQLASINDVFNGVLVKGNATGDVVFYGKGAGKLPTASAVVADIIDAVKADGTSVSLRWDDSSENIVEDKDNYACKFYARAVFGFDCASLSAIKSVFGDVEAINTDIENQNEIAFVTENMTEKEFDQKVQLLLEGGVKVVSKIRVLEY